MKNPPEKCFRVSSKKLVPDKTTNELALIEIHFDFQRYQKARWKYRQLLLENYRAMKARRINAFKLCMNRLSEEPWASPLYQETENGSAIQKQELS